MPSIFRKACVRGDTAITKLSICIQHDVHDGRIGHADVFAFLKPLRFNVFRRLVGQDHQRLFDSLTRRSGSRKNNIDVSCRPLVAMRGEGVSANQQLIDSVRIERTEQGLQILKCRRTCSLFGHDLAR
jgi:hypothetical protein